MNTKIVIAGSRTFNNYPFFSKAVDACLSSFEDKSKLVILSGHCSGADLMAERYAQERGIKTEIFPADWKKYGRAAGPIRNKQMVDIADYAIAFPSGGNGTKSLIALAEKKGIPIRIFPISE